MVSMAGESGAGGRGNRSGNGNGSEDAYEFALVDALGRLSPDAEPPMPDLVPGATVRAGGSAVGAGSGWR